MAPIKIPVRPARWLATCATAVMVGAPLLAGVAGAAEAAHGPGGVPHLPLKPGGNGPTPDISVDDVTTAEGSGGPTGFHFTVSLSSPSDVEVTARVLAADGSATNPGDWQAVATELVFAPGETAKEFVVSVVGDDEVEDDEVFAVMVEDIDNAGIGDVEGLGTIIDDDADGGEGGGAAGGEEGGSGDGDGSLAPDVDDAVVDDPTLDGSAEVDRSLDDERPTRGDDAAPPRDPRPAAPGSDEALPLAVAGVGAAGAGVVAVLMAWRRRRGVG